MNAAFSEDFMKSYGGYTVNGKLLTNEEVKNLRLNFLNNLRIHANLSEIKIVSEVEKSICDLLFVDVAENFNFNADFLRQKFVCAITSDTNDLNKSMENENVICAITRQVIEYSIFKFDRFIPAKHYGFIGRKKFYNAEEYISSKTYPTQGDDVCFFSQGNEEDISKSLGYYLNLASGSN
jgi:hypothetical protein